jgi:hypothetical protein
MFQQEDAAIQPALIEGQTFIAYQKQFSNLSIQELRLRRQYQKDLAELRQLQNGRAQRDKQPKITAKTAQAPAPLTATPGIYFVFASGSQVAPETAFESALNGNPLAEAA